MGKHGVLIKKLAALRKYVKYQGKIMNLTINQIRYSDICKGKKIIITGGSDGIGLAMAKKFISQGADVLITGRTSDKLERAKSEIGSSNLSILKWDVSDFANMTSKLNEAYSILGGLDVFVNNAAFLEHYNTDIDFYDKTMNTNLKAPFYICHNVISYYLKHNKDKISKIINISSINAFQNSDHPLVLLR